MRAFAADYSTTGPLGGGGPGDLPPEQQAPLHPTSSVGMATSMQHAAPSAQQQQQQRGPSPSHTSAASAGATATMAAAATSVATAAAAAAAAASQHQETVTSAPSLERGGSGSVPGCHPQRASAWGNSRDAVFLPQGWVPPTADEADLLHALLEGVESDGEQQQQGPLRADVAPRAPRAGGGGGGAARAAAPVVGGGGGTLTALEEELLMLGERPAPAQRRRHSVASYTPMGGDAAAAAAAFAGLGGAGGAAGQQQAWEAAQQQAAQQQQAALEAVPPLPMGTDEALPGRRGLGNAGSMRASRRRSME